MKTLETLRPGDRWNEHYRGTHYHFGADRTIWWEVPETHERVLAVSGADTVVDQLLHLRPTGGSFRATETGAYIIKSQEDPANPDEWIPLYVQDVDEPLLFADVDPLGANLRPGELWTSFYDGAKYRFSGDRIWWVDPETGRRVPVKDRLPPEVHAVLRQYKPAGGSFRITENGKVIALIPPTPLPARVQEQYQQLTTRQKNLLVVKKKKTDMVPIYIGEYLDGFVLAHVPSLNDPLSEDEQKTFASFMKKGYGIDIEAPEIDDDRDEG